jgi:DNA-binding SARP family transcriptional activator
MSMNEPGLDLHEWETRWAELEEALAEDPAEALPLACDEIEELLQIHEGDEILRAQYTELEAAYEAAREVADRYEQGVDVDPGDLGAAIENLRTIRQAVLPAGPA